MSLPKKIAFNTIIQAIGKISSVFVVLIALGFITRYLGSEGYGDYATALAFLSFFGILSDMGLCTILAREISKDGADKKKITSNIFTLRLAADLVIFTSVPIIALFFNYSSVVKQAIAIGALAFFFASAGQVLHAIFQNELKVSRIAIAEFFGKFIFLILSICIIKFSVDKTSRSFLLAMAIANSLMLFFIVYFARKFVKFSFRADLKYWKKIMKIAIPMSLALVFNRIYFKVDTLMLSFLKGSKDVGIYDLPYRVLEVIIFLASIFAGIVFPLLSKYIGSNAIKFKEIFKGSQDVLILASTPILFGGFILAKPIIILLGGAEFLVSVKVFQILMFAVVIMFLNALVAHVIIAADKEKDLAKIHFVGAVLSITTNLIFIPLFTYIGASVTTIFVELIMLILGYVVVYKTVRYIPSFKIIIKSIFASICMAGVLWGLLSLKSFALTSGFRNLAMYIAQLFLYIFAGVIVYGAVLYSIGGLQSPFVIARSPRDEDDEAIS